MARVTNLFDDIDGSPDAKERRFSIEDEEYVIDLTDLNFNKFKFLISKYLNNARKVPRKTERKNYAPVLNKEDRAKIRAWAISNGRYVPSRGRFPADLIRDYYATMRNQPQELILG